MISSQNLDASKRAVYTIGLQFIFLSSTPAFYKKFKFERNINHHNPLNINEENNCTFNGKLKFIKYVFNILFNFFKFRNLAYDYTLFPLLTSHLNLFSSKWYARALMVPLNPLFVTIFHLNHLNTFIKTYFLLMNVFSLKRSAYSEAGFINSPLKICSCRIWDTQLIINFLS